MLQAEGVEALRASEVHNLDGVEVGHHDVVGLEVQVEDAPVVEVLDPLEDLDQVARDVVLGVTEPLASRKKKEKKVLKRWGAPVRRVNPPKHADPSHLSMRLCSSSLPVQYSATRTR